MPYPFAAEDHQTVNAMHLVQQQAALMIKDQDAAGKLVPTAIALVADEVLQLQLTENLASLSVTNADQVIANEILAQLQ